MKTPSTPPARRSRIRPFETEAEIADYIAGDLIECLECGRRFRQLSRSHLRLHGMTADEYRERWALPRLTPLAGKATREGRSRIIRRQIDEGKLTYDHLASAVEAARAAVRPGKVPAQALTHSQRVSALRPGDHHLLPPGSKRADGRDADRARAYQQQYRARSNDASPEVPARTDAPWSDAERQFLVDNFMQHTFREIADAMGRPFNEVMAMAHKLRLKKRTLPTPRLWTDQEHQFLMDQFPHHTIGELAEALGRTRPATQVRCLELGLRKRAIVEKRPYSPAEDAFLVAFYGHRQTQWIAEQLGRTVSALIGRAHKLRLSPRVTKGPFSESELALIRDHFPIQGSAWLAERLGRSAATIQVKANLLGLRRLGRRRRPRDDGEAAG